MTGERSCRTAGVEPYAISRDSPYTHVAWMQALDLDFPLLSDWNAEATHGFGVAIEHNGMRDVSRAQRRSSSTCDGVVRGAWAYEPSELPDLDELIAAARACSRVLTCDHLVTYDRGMDDDQVFKALADPTRRFLLDRLFERDGRTLTELESELEMTRFGVMKHLRVLEDAGLVVTRREGREKLHFLNPVPIRLIHDRWIDKYTERRVAALADLKHELEENCMTHDDRADHAGVPGVHQGDARADLGGDHEAGVHAASTSTARAST